MCASPLGCQVSAYLHSQVAHEVEAGADEVEHGGAVRLEGLRGKVVQILHTMLLKGRSDRVRIQGFGA